MAGGAFVDTSELIALGTKLRDVAAELHRPDAILKAIGVEALAEVDRIFRVGGDPPWPALAESTQAAKRQGKGGGGAGLPLQGLRGTFDARIEAPKTVLIESNDFRTAFHEFGTHGPYEIRAKNAKALALPFLPGRDGAGKPGRFSLAGLGSSRRGKAGSFIFSPARGQRVSKRLAGRIGKTVSPYTKVAFYDHVTHPGLKKRQMLPTAAQLGPRLVAAADALFTRLVTKLVSH